MIETPKHIDADTSECKDCGTDAGSNPSAGVRRKPAPETQPKAQVRDRPDVVGKVGMQA